MGSGDTAVGKNALLAFQERGVVLFGMFLS
jgi:hypothetical protein